jgi:hypothetical protein
MTRLSHNCLLFILVKKVGIVFSRNSLLRSALLRPQGISYALSKSFGTRERAKWRSLFQCRDWRAVSPEFPVLGDELIHSRPSVVIQIEMIVNRRPRSGAKKPFADRLGAGPAYWHSLSSRPETKARQAAPG